MTQRDNLAMKKCPQIYELKSVTILVWNELHLRSKASGIWQSDKIDKHFFHYKTLVNFSNCRCNNRQTLFKFQKNLSIFRISKNRQMLFHYFKTLVIFWLFTQRSTNIIIKTLGKFFPPLQKSTDTFSQHKNL